MFLWCDWRWQWQNEEWNAHTQRFPFRMKDQIVWKIFHVEIFYFTIHIHISTIIIWCIQMWKVCLMHMALVIPFFIFIDFDIFGFSILHSNSNRTIETVQKVFVGGLPSVRHHHLLCGVYVLYSFPFASYSFACQDKGAQIFWRCTLAQIVPISVALPFSHAE